MPLIVTVNTIVNVLGQIAIYILGGGIIKQCYSIFQSSCVVTCPSHLNPELTLMSNGRTITNQKAFF